MPDRDKLPILGVSSPELHRAMNRIMDTFGGADGGGSFLNLCQLINRLDEIYREDNGTQSQSARQVLNVLLRMERMIQVACNETLP